jgi:pyruvate/2-oxoglutarate dehydrogenase complex dihydrolipoamide acyltransferase (E2) component
MSPVSKRQQTQAKRNREHTAQQKSTHKREKKRAAAAARAAAKEAGVPPGTSPMVEGNPGREN